MKIEQVKVILTSPNQNYLFVKLITDSGVYGVGDASLNGQEHTVADFITSFLTPILIGRDPTQIEDFWQLVYRGAYWRGGNIVMSALCGVDHGFVGYSGQGDRPTALPTARRKGAGQGAVLLPRAGQDQ